MGDKNLLMCSIKFSSDNNFVNIKNGNNAGATDVDHTSKPLTQADIFSFGFATKSNIKAITKTDKKIVFLLDKFKFFGPLFCIVFINSVNY